MASSARLTDHFGMRTIDPAKRPSSAMVEAVARRLPKPAEEQTNAGVWVPLGVWEAAASLAVKTPRQAVWQRALIGYVRTRFLTGSAPPLIAPTTVTAIWLAIAIEAQAERSLLLQWLRPDDLASLRPSLEVILRHRTIALDLAEQFMVLECALLAGLAPGDTLARPRLAGLELASCARYAGLAFDGADGPRAAGPAIPPWMQPYLASRLIARGAHVRS